MMVVGVETVAVDTRMSTHSADREYRHLIEYTKTTKMLPQ